MGHVGLLPTPVFDNGLLSSTGCLTLPEILEIYWNNFSLLEIYWKSYLLIC